MDLLLAHGCFLAEDAHERKMMKPYRSPRASPVVSPRPAGGR